MSNLNLNGVGKVYPSGKTALYDVSLDADDREFLVVLGGEESGKSTLLKVVAGLEEPSTGVVSIDGKDVTDVDPKDRNVAMIFRNDTLFPSMNVFDNMAYGLKMRKAPQALIEQRVKVVANILGLTEALYRKPKALTAAARQRVAIGRAVCREPKLYLFDEPLAGIDENLRADLLNVIINLQARVGGTFLYATKNVSEALSIGTRIVVLKKGMVQQIDVPANLYDYPANTYVAFLVGSPTINFIQNAKIVRDGEAYFAEFFGERLCLPANIVNRFKNIGDYADGGAGVILGVRPEDAAVSDGGVKAVCAKAEENGYAEFTLGGKPFTAKCAGVAAGAEVMISVDAERLMIFDSATRLTLLERDAGYKDTGRADAELKPYSYIEEQAILEKLKPKKEVKKKR